MRERWGADEVSVAVEDGYMVQEWARLGYDRQRTRYVRWRWTLEEDGERRQRRRSRERQVFIIIIASPKFTKMVLKRFILGSSDRRRHGIAEFQPIAG